MQTSDTASDRALREQCWRAMGAIFDKRRGRWMGPDNRVFAFNVADLPAIVALAGAKEGRDGG